MWAGASRARFPDHSFAHAFAAPCARWTATSDELGEKRPTLMDRSLVNALTSYKTTYESVLGCWCTCGGDGRSCVGSEVSVRSDRVFRANCFLPRGASSIRGSACR